MTVNELSWFSCKTFNNVKNEVCTCTFVIFQVIYEDTCIPTKKELPVLMGYVIKLGYRPVGSVNDNQSVVLS